MTGTGIGPALRQARLLRGKSIEQASRDTRIRPEYLHALEGERFDSLIGDVYTRGFLRSYSSYLGLDPDKVAGVYSRAFGPPAPARADLAHRVRNGHPHLADAVRHHPSWAFLVVVAALALAVFGAAGLLSGSKAAPEPTTPAPAPGAVQVLPPPVVIELSARDDVRAVITVDGRRVGRPELPGGVIRTGQGLSFRGDARIDLWFERGGVVEISVNGRDLGRPGTRKAPYRASFLPNDFRRSP